MKTFKFSALFLLVLALCAGIFISGCGSGGSAAGDGGTTPPPGTPAGTGSFSGQITDELGAGIQGVKITAAGGSGNVSAGAAEGDSGKAFVDLIATTGENGEFTLTGLNVGNTYNITITRTGRKTLTTTISVTTEIPSLSMILIAPEGNEMDTVEFKMPKPLRLNSPITRNTEVDLTWENSTNPGFLAYIVYRSQTAGAGTFAEQIAINMAPNDIAHTDSLSAVGQVYYYRVYEKILLPELGTFIMVGTNEVQSFFPGVTAFSPTGNSAAVNLPIEITFDTAMDQQSVENGFAITSDVPGQTISGTKSWDGNTFRFTPTTNVGYARNITVTVSGAMDTLGNEIISPMTWNFTTKIGYVFERKWGSQGTGNGQFREPFGVSVDSNDSIYISDPNNDRIQKFDSQGNFIALWSGNVACDPRKFVFDALNNRYALEASQVLKFDSTDHWVFTKSGNVPGDGQFGSATGIAVDADENFYVVDGVRILKFDTNGNFIKKWGSLGTGDGQFWTICGIAVNPSGKVYVLDGENRRVQVFDSNGNFITKWGKAGSGYGEFQLPENLTIDSSGNVYVGDTGNSNTQKFDSQGNYITQWGTQGSGDGQFLCPSGIAVDSDGNVYVSDHGNYHVQKFVPDP